ncbi:hypothetical protein ACS0TY_021194 [Phlomoides rotata]
MSTGAADLMFRCVFDASLSLHDMDIERRPYHRNCECALHKTKGKCTHSASQQRNVAFTRKEIRSKCCYSLSSSSSSKSCYVHHSSSWNREGFSLSLVTEEHNVSR